MRVNDKRVAQLAENGARWHSNQEIQSLALDLQTARQALREIANLADRETVEKDDFLRAIVRASNALK